MPGSAPEYVEGHVVPADDAPAVARAYFDSINSENWEQLAGVWADGAELLAVGARPRCGRDEIMEFYGGIFEPWSAHMDQPTRFVVAGDLVFTEIEFTGVTHDGRQIVFPAVDVFELAGDQVRKLSIWYDLTWVRKQL